MKNKIKLLSTIAAVAITLEAAAVPEVFAVSWSSGAAEHMSKLVKMDSDDFYNSIYDMVSEEDLSQYSTDVTTDIEIPIGSSVITVDGNEVSISDVDSSAVPAILYENTTMVPIRMIGNLLDCETEWDDETKTVSVSNSEKTVTVQTLREGEEWNNSKGIIHENKTMIPLRMVSEKLGCDVGWSGGGSAGGGIASISNYNDEAFEMKRLIIKLADENTPMNGVLEEVISHSAKYLCSGKMLVITFPTAEDTKKAYNLLKGNSAFEYVEADKVIEINFPGQTAGENMSWGVDYCGFSYFIEKYKDDLNAYEGSITIGVLDTGLNFDHQLFSEIIDEEDKNNKGVLTDINGHGTHVAGIVSVATAATGVLKGKIKIKPYRVITDKDGKFTSVSLFVSALDAAKKSCNIVNMSLELPLEADGADYSCGLDNGPLIVAAAGNSKTELKVNIIARDTDGIVVTAIDEYSNPADFSNYSENTNKQKSMIAAPGVDIPSASINDNNSVDTYLSGTSQAAPHVTAAAALLMIKTKKTDPSYIKSELLKCVNADKAIDSKYGVGILDLKAYGEEKTNSEPEQPSVITGYRWSEDSLTIKKGETKKITLYEKWSDGRETAVTDFSAFYSSKESVATISSDGTIKAISAGSTKIAAAQSGIASIDVQGSVPTLSVTVIEPTAEPTIIGYRWSETSLTLKKGETKKITLYAKWSDGSERAITDYSAFYSSKESVATISSDGTIKAISAGSTKIATAQSGIASIDVQGSVPTLSVTVTEPVAAEPIITAFEWSQSELEMNVGDTAQVKLYAVMDDGSRKDVTGSSSFYSNDENVAVISSNGVITAKGAGNTYIMLAQSGIASVSARNAKIKITVVEEQTDYEVSSYGGGVEIVGYSGADRYLAIPSSIGGKNVVRIGDNAFSRNKTITSVSVPSTVREIGSSAFADCSGLKSISLPNGISSIESYAFDSCSKLSSINIPSCVDVISAYTFRGCSSLKELTVPNGVSEIKNSAFANCKTLSITIPDSVRSIDTNAFTKGNFIIIYGKAGSAAEQYANANGFTFYEE